MKLYVRVYRTSLYTREALPVKKKGGSWRSTEETV